MINNVAIIGSGSWGIALAVHIAKLGKNVKAWSYSKEEQDYINNERKCKFLPNLDRIPDGITCYDNFEDVIKDTDLILHVTPSKFTRDTVKQYKQYVTTQPILVCSKGLEKESLLPLTEVVKQEIPNVVVGALCGPSHAEEVALGMATAMVVATPDEKTRNEVQAMLMNENMRVYTSSDVIGVEVGSALKNIVAFCAGIVAEKELGDNCFAALATRGLVEIVKLGTAMGGKKETFYGLTGLGDLIVTCLSEHSRNRKAGRLIGRGLPLDEVRKEVGMVIESVDNIDVAYKLSKIYNIEMPIVDTVYDVLYNGLTPLEGIKRLMTRDKKEEED